MTMYGFRLEITMPGMTEGTRGIKRVELDAPDQATAQSWLDGWAAVEGKTIVSRELLTDGMTFREAGKRRALEIAAHLATRYGATVEGPWEAPGDPVVVRVTLPNGKGVSLATDGRQLYDPAPAVEALAFDGDDWLGDPERDVDAEWCASMLDDLLK